MIFFPISDDDSKLKRIEWVTILLILANIAVYIYQVQNPDFTSGYSAVPREITTNTDLVKPQPISIEQKIHQIPQAPGPYPIFLTLFSAMFMHGNLAHLGSNMLFLWIFGDNVENRFGAFRFILFYLAAGLIASMAHILTTPNSVVPTLGASGAIAGVLGAYLVMFPKNKVNFLLFFVKIVSFPAIVVILLWGLMQLIPVLTLPKTEGGGVAYLAHLGGLAVGIVLGLAFKLMMEQEPDSILARNSAHDPKARRGLL